VLSVVGGLAAVLAGILGNLFGATSSNWSGSKDSEDSGGEAESEGVVASSGEAESWDTNAVAQANEWQAKANSAADILKGMQPGDPGYQEWVDYKNHCQDTANGYRNLVAEILSLAGQNDQDLKIFLEPVDEDAQNQTIDNVEQNTSDAELAGMTLGEWKRLTDDQKKDQIKIFKEKLEKEMGVGPIDLFFTTDPTYKYGGHFDANTNPPSITLAQNKLFDSPMASLNTLAHELRHAQQKWGNLETPNSQAASDLNQNNYTSPETDFSKYLNQFQERDSRSFGSKFGNDLSKLAYGKKLDQIESMLKDMAKYQPKKISQSTFFDIMENRPDLKDQLQEKIRDGSIEVQEPGVSKASAQRELGNIKRALEDMAKHAPKKISSKTFFEIMENRPDLKGKLQTMIRDGSIEVQE